MDILILLPIIGCAVIIWFIAEPYMKEILYNRPPLVIPPPPLATLSEDEKAEIDQILNIAMDEGVQVVRHNRGNSSIRLINPDGLDNTNYTTKDKRFSPIELMVYFNTSIR